MPVAGNESLSELRSELVEMITKAEDFHQRNLKGELSPDEIAEMKDLGDEITSYESAIKAFPTVEGFRERVDSTKRFLRTPATPAPFSPGKTTGGDGASLHANRQSGSPQGGPPHGAQIKSLGDLLIEERLAQKSGGYGWREGHQQQTWAVEIKGLDRLDGFAADDGIGEPSPFKATLTSSGATLTSYTRPAGIVGIEQQRLTVADLMAQGTTDGPTIRYVKEDSYTNAADTVLEAGEKPEATFAFSEVDAPVRKIAVRAKVSEEMWDDFQQLRSFIDGRLRFMIMQAEEAQLLSGGGTAPDLRGILQTVGIQTESGASAADNAEAVHRGITKVRAVGFFEPDGVIVHPTDYQNFRLMRDGNEQYYGGGPFVGPYGNGPMAGGVLPLWSLRTVVTTAITTGTVLVGAFQLGAQIFRRSGVTVQAVNTNEDDFNNNLISLRAEERLALAVYRPKAFTAVTLSAWS